VQGKDRELTQVTKRYAASPPPYILKLRHTCFIKVAVGLVSFPALCTKCTANSPFWTTVCVLCVLMMTTHTSYTHFT
jgi:hypothetical protein